MILSDLFHGLDLFNDHLKTGLISEMRHPEYKELSIFNYTHLCQHEDIWDVVTKQCRGLIVDRRTDQVIARGFIKFHNFNDTRHPETLEANLPNYTPTVLEKLDGSMGLLYYWGDKPAISTRGSFASDQAKWATQYYTNHVRVRVSSAAADLSPMVSWPIGYTPVFEIIYKENRIVVSYDFEGLVLLGFVHIETGFELPYEDVVHYAELNGFRYPQVYKKPLSKCIEDNMPNTEGYVLQYWCNKAPIPLRIKIKTKDYVRLHKIITGLNPKGIWEHLKEGFDPAALWYPAEHNKEFVKWCLHWIKIFETSYKKIEDEAIRTYAMCSIQVHKKCTEEDRKPTRKDYAISFTASSQRLCPVLFQMLDGHDYSKMTWKMLEPKITSEGTFLRDGDSNNGI